jgi:N,N-dimethylformamidase
MYEIDPERLDLAREFKACIYGRHSGELQRVLNRMRGGANAGRYVIICTKRHREWVLARMGQRAGHPLEPVPGCVFQSEEEAEWMVFKLRWRELTGRELAIE